MPESSRRKLRSLVTKIRTEVKGARKLKAEGNLSPDVALCPVGVIRDPSSRSYPPVDVRFALKATELMRGGEMSEGPKEDIGSFWAHGFRPKRPGSGRAWLTRAA